MGEIKSITKKIKKFRDERDWKQFHNHKDMALSLMLEAAEVLEHFQWKSSVEVDGHARECKDEITDELADVAMYLFELADNLGIDIPKAINNKMIKNANKYPVEKVKGRHTKYVDFNYFSIPCALGTGIQLFGESKGGRAPWSFAGSIPCDTKGNLFLLKNELCQSSSLMNPKTKFIIPS